MSLIEKIREVWQEDPRRLVVVTFGLAALLGAGLILLSAYVSPNPRVVVAGARQVATKPLMVKFSLPPNREKMEVRVEPEIDVSLQWTGGFFGRMSRTLLIVPDTQWEVDRSYRVEFSNVEGVVGFGKHSEEISDFRVQELPEVSKVSVSGLKDVAVDEPISINLSAPSQGLAEFFFELSPKTAFTATNNDSDYLLRFDDRLEQGTKYRLVILRQLIVTDSQSGEIEKRLEKKKVFQTTFSTVAPVLIKSFKPQGQAVLPTSKKITLTFSEDMNRPSVEDGLSLSPKINGQWRWKNDNTYEFTANSNLSIDTKYVVKLARGIEAKSGSFLDEDEVLSFKTVGAVRVVSTTPANLSAAASLTGDVKITFDQPIVKDSLKGRLIISPSVGFSHQLSGNTLTVSPQTALDYYRTYTVTVKSGLVAIYGKPLVNDYQLKFTTELKRVVLNIPIDYQDRALSCEAAALKMALNYRGLNISEGNIMAVIGYDPTIKSGNTWGDPDVAFVGNIDGSQNSTGYGVHWGPIAKAAKKWRQASAFTNWTASKLASAIENGNPVVIWGVLGNAYYDPWKTPSGRTIAAWKGEHARTVIGYTGSPSNPANFIINDPIVGRVTWSTATLLGNWGTFNNSGVVVY